LDNEILKINLDEILQKNK